MVWVSSGDNIVWGLTTSGELWYRAGVDQNNQMGTNWEKLNTGVDTNVQWKMVEVDNGHLWGIDTSDKLMCRKNATQDNILGGNAVNLYDENGNFKSFNIQDKPSSYAVSNGGWVIYSMANFKGKFHYHHDGDCFSNDPANPKGPKLRSWQEPIGSVRPLRGLDWRCITVNVELDWAGLTTNHQTDVVNKVEEKNNTFDYSPPSWDKYKHVEAKLEHKFVLSEPVPGIGGCTFYLEGVPKPGITFANVGNKFETGVDFRQELNNMFTFHTEATAERSRSKLEVVRFPPLLQPMTQIAVAIVIHKGIIKMPFKATFSSGNSTWTVPGCYTGLDATQIKLEFQEVCLRESIRKISKI